MSMVTDLFNRANENPLSGGGNWGGNGVDAQFQVVSNQAQSAVAMAVSRYTGTTFGADQWSSVKATGSDGSFVVVRSQPSAATYYFAGKNSGSKIYKSVAGTQTLLASKACTWVAGDAMELRIVGSVLTLLRNGVVELTVTDTSITAAGAPGIAGSGGTTVTMDDWVGGDVGASADLVVAPAQIVPVQAVTQVWSDASIQGKVDAYVGVLRDAFGVALSQAQRDNMVNVLKQTAQMKAFEVADEVRRGSLALQALMAQKMLMFLGGG